MTVYYFDSSALVKLYIPEAGSPRVDQIVNSRNETGEMENVIFFSVISIAEATAAISRRWRTGHIDENTRRRLYAALLDDRERLFTTLAINDETVLSAAELTLRFPLRGYDAVHLASALAFNQLLVAAGQDPLVFVASDETLLQAAYVAGLRTENPVD